MSDIDITVEEQADVVIELDTNVAYVVQALGTGAASMLTTKGDLLGYSTLPERIPVGTSGTILTADPDSTNGISWAEPVEPETNQIFQEDSSVTVTDTGTNGKVSTTVDGFELIKVENRGNPIVIRGGMPFHNDYTPLVFMESYGGPNNNKGAVLWLETNRSASPNDIDVFKVSNSAGELFAIDNAGGTMVNGGQRITEFSTDTSLGDSSDTALPTERAVKTYVNNQVDGVSASDVSPLTTKGDIWVYSSANARLPLGTDDYVLTADSSEATGLKWAASTGGTGDKIEEGNSSVEVVDTGTGEIAVTVDGVEQMSISDGDKKINLPLWTFPEGVYMNNDKLVFYTDGDGSDTRSTTIGYKAMGSYNAEHAEHTYDYCDTWQTLCFGQNAAQKLTTGSNNCCIGVQTGANISDSDNNCFLGTRAGYYVSTDSTTPGGENTAIGYYAGYYGDICDQNVFIGSRCGFGTNGGDVDKNVFIGSYAGNGVDTAGSNILIGYSAYGNESNYDDKLVIENSNDSTNPLIYGEMGSESDNKLCIGSASPKTTGKGLTVNGEIAPDTDDSFDLGNTNYRWDDIYATNDTIQTSDGRCKESVYDSDLGLDFILEVKPKSYVFKDTVIDEPYEEYEEVDDVEEYFENLNIDIDSILDKDEQYEIVWKDGVKKYRIFRNVKKTLVHKKTRQKTIPHNRRHYGIVAQDIESILEKNDIDTKNFAGFVKDKETGRYSLRYGEFIAPMIKSIQELNQKVEVLEEENDLLKTQMASVLERLEALEAK